MQIQIGKVSEGRLASHDIDVMHALRYEVFRERLQWDVPCHDGRERDRFDALDPTYMLVRTTVTRCSAAGACCRPPAPTC
jgi:acyl homoserine lactone synthase